MRTIIPPEQKFRLQEETEVVDLGWGAAILSFRIGFFNEDNVFVDYIPAQSVYLGDIKGLIRLRDALIKALPLTYDVE